MITVTSGSIVTSTIPAKSEIYVLISGNVRAPTCGGLDLQKE